jgi:hypothetical protein
VDGGHSLSANGSSDNPPGVFNQSLYSATDLPYALHDVILKNTPGPLGGDVDLDWAVVEIGDGNVTSSNTDVWLDDTATGNFTYDENWTAGLPTNTNLPLYYNSTFQSVGTITRVLCLLIALVVFRALPVRRPR